MHLKTLKSLALTGLLAAGLPLITASPPAIAEETHHQQMDLNSQLRHLLQEAGFTGKIQQSIPSRLGRPINAALFDLGRLLFHDNILGTHKDNSCAGCHSAAVGFGDTQSIAIGTDNNGIVGPNRAGPRNQRRAPMAANTGLYPRMMLNSRFLSNSQNAFDLSEGAEVPFAVGGRTVWTPGAACMVGTCFDPAKMTILLSVQGHLPPTELVEMAGFSMDNPSDTDSRLYHPPHIVSSGEMADTVPGPIAGPNGSPPDSYDTGYAIRAKLITTRINTNPTYVAKFAAIYPEAAGGHVTFAMVGAALAEFQLANTYADAPLDRFARGTNSAMTDQQKRGAVLFFGELNCVACHAVAGNSNEMFSDFMAHNAAIPPIAPAGFGLRPGGDPRNPADFPGNFMYSGPDANEDFGMEEVTGSPVDRYRFRSSPLRNIKLQPAFFHNGSFTRLDAALRYHLNPLAQIYSYNPAAQGLDADLTVRKGPIAPIVKRIDPLIVAMSKISLSATEFNDLLAFVRDGLYDSRVAPANLCTQVPATVPSGIRQQVFQGC
jgi:cytochrome c peroxidase